MLNALITFRARSIGSENVPIGPLILAPNHASFMDHFFAGAFIRRRVQFMAKSQIFSPGRRSGSSATAACSRSGAAARTRRRSSPQRTILERGGVIGMYCEGGRSRSGQMADEAKPGIGRLALDSGAPIVPVAILGSHQVRNWKKLRFPKVIVRYGTPFRYERLPERHARPAAGGRRQILRADPGDARRAGRRSAPRGSLRAARRGELRSLARGHAGGHSRGQPAAHVVQHGLRARAR